MAKKSALKDARLSILSMLVVWLESDLPGIRFDKSPEGRPRMIIPRSGSDSYLFDFSSEVRDGIRCAYVLDLDQVRSARRSSFQIKLQQATDAVEEILGCEVVSKVSNPNLVKQNLLSWAKISKHSRMGIHCFYRFPDLDWESNAEAVVGEIGPYILRFVEGMDSLLQEYQPSAATSGRHQ